MSILRKTAIAFAAMTVLTTSAIAAENWKLGSAKAGADIGLVFDQELINSMNTSAGEALVVEHQFIGNEQEMVQQVLRGRVQMGVTSAFGVSGAIPDAAVISIPFLWKSNEERVFVTEKYIRPLLEKRFAEKGLKLLSIQESGYNGFFCSFDCSDAASMEGAKARVSASLISQAMWKALGANGVQLSIADLWPALEQKLVVAGDLPMAYYVTTPGVQSAPHFVVSNHLHHPWLYFVNVNHWNKLSKEAQDAILAGLAADNSTVQRYADDEAGKFKAFTEKGGILHELTAEQRQKWEDTVLPQMAAVVKNIGPGAVELYDSINLGKEEFAKTQ